MTKPPVPLQAATTRQVVALVAVVLAAAALLVGGPILLGGQTFADPRHLLGTLPVLDALGESLARGELREWWDAIGLGVPLAGNRDHAALYPLTWLGAVGGPRVIDMVVIAHAVASGAGAAVLARRLGAGAVGAATAAGGMVAAAMVGQGFGHAGTAMALGWAAWVVWAADRLSATDRGSLGLRALALAALSGGQLCTGQLSIALATGVVAFVFAVARARGSIRVTAWLLIGFAGGLLLAAHVLLPALYIELTGPPPFAGRPAGTAALIGLIRPGSWYLGLPIACAIVASRAWVVLAIALAALGAAAAVGAQWSIPALALLCAAAGVGLERLIAGVDRHVLIAAAAVVVAGGGLGLSADSGSLPATISAAVAGALAIGCAALCRGRARAWAGPLLAAIAVGHSIAHASHAVATVSRTQALARPAMLPESLDGERLSRPPLPIDGEPAADPSARAGRDRDTLAPAVATRFGFAYDRGTDRAQSPRLDRIWRAAAVGAERFLDLYAVDLVVVPASVAIPSGLPIAARSADGRLALARNERRRPRAFTTARWEWYDDEARLLAELFPPARDARLPIRLATVRLLGRGPSAAAARGPTPMRACDRYDASPDHLVLECEAEADGYAVVVDAWAPGWEATVDGRPAAIERADLLVRAVAIPAGRHSIDLRYKTPGLRWGSAVAGLAWLNALVLSLVLVRMRARRGASTTASDLPVS